MKCLGEVLDACILCMLGILFIFVGLVNMIALFISYIYRPLVLNDVKFYGIGMAFVFLGICVFRGIKFPEFGVPEKCPIHKTNLFVWSWKKAECPKCQEELKKAFA